jgi:tetratricopeptide (TPR) repeat protein
MAMPSSNESCPRAPAKAGVPELNRSTAVPASSLLRLPFGLLRQGNPIALCVLLLALVVCVFLPSLRNGFVNYDDNLYVTDNFRVQAGLTWPGLVWSFAKLHGDGTYWHPLTWVSHMMDCQLYGLRPWGHHLTSLLLHAVNTLLVFLVFRRMTAASWRCAFLAALFALHPLQVDTVAWVAERKNLLSTLFWLLTIWAYVRYAQKRVTGEIRGPVNQQPNPARQLQGSTFDYLLTLVFFVCGMMCKPVLVTLPFVLLLLDYWPLQRFHPAPNRAACSALTRLFLEKAPLFLLAAVSSLITILAHRSLGMLGSDAPLPFNLRAANAVVSYVRYLGKTIWPFNLAVFYPYPDTWAISEVVLCGLLLLAASALAVRASRRCPYLFVGWFWFLGVLVPFIGLVQVGAQAMADRFMYVPLLGLSILAIWGATNLAARWPHRHATLGIVGAAALAVCGCTSHFQIKHWKDGLTLFSHAIAVTQNNALAECNLGNALGAQGHRKEAITHLQEALRLNPAYAEAHVNFGVALVLEGKTGEAIQHYQAAIECRPNYAQAHRFLAGALALEHKNDEAKQEFLAALRFKPDYPEAHARLGNLLSQQGENEEALRHLFEAVKIRDDCEDGHYFLASALARVGRIPEAAVHFQAALRLQPNHAAALNDLAWILATERDPAIRNVLEAIRLGMLACQFSAYTNAAYLDTLGTALSEANRWAEAIGPTEKAVALAAASGQEKLASQIQNHLQLYRAELAHQPQSQENAR